MGTVVRGPTAWDEHLSESCCTHPQEGLLGPQAGGRSPAVCEPRGLEVWGFSLEGGLEPGPGVTGARTPGRAPGLATHGAQEAPGSCSGSPPAGSPSR